MATLWACAGMFIASATRAQTPVADQLVISRLDPAALVLGIVDYTRWPGQDRPLMICGSRGGQHSERLAPNHTHPPSARRLSVRLVEPDDVPPAECDVIVFEGWSDGPMFNAMRATGHRPTLTVGFGAAFCSDGGMVCFSAEPAGWTFEVNTDAVAQSGLRINPRVLHLTRSRQRAS
jgi:YfiR/HmsC-like